MCLCPSCEYTDRLAGLPDLFGELDVPYLMPGRTERAVPSFHAWPCDKPKGSRASAAEYRGHVAHLWEGIAKTVPFRPGQAPQYPADTSGIAGPLPYPTKLVADFIKAGAHLLPKDKPRNIPPVILKSSTKKIPPLVALARQLRKAA